jgi:hypothetical protein
MFVLDPNPEFWAPVKVRKPGGGEETFKACFRALTIEEFKSYDLNDPEGSARFLVTTLIGTSDIEGPRKEKLKHSDALRDQLIDLPYVRHALINAYLVEINAAVSGN